MSYHYATSIKFEPCACNKVKVPRFALKFFYILISNFIIKFGFANGDFPGEFDKGRRSGSYFFEDTNHMPWDDLDLQFLNVVKGSTLHRNNDFHVVKAKFSTPPEQESVASTTSSYIIHMSKTEGLFHLEHLNLTKSETEDMRCIFSGTITEITGHQEPKHGLISLSSCHHEFGFEGLILLPHQQYYIKPQLTPSQHRARQIHQRLFRRSATLTTQKTSIPHKAYKINDKASQLKAGHVDDVKIPPPELLQKAHEKAVSIDHLEDEEDSFGLDDGISGGLQDLEENVLVEDDHNAPCLGSSCSRSKASPLTTKSNQKGKHGKSSKGKGKEKAGRTNSRKPTTMSQNTGTKVVEIAVFTDETLYKIFKSRYPKNTQTKLNQYILAVINNMNALYKQPSMTDKVTFRLVHVEIQTYKPSALRDHHADAEKYLTSFCNYESEKNQQGQLWDHGLLLTGLDLQQQGSNGVAGIAWFSTMCINGLSCSVIEAYNFGSAFITTHEIGHSLGMEHDGDGRNKGCDANSYIMSPTTGAGKTDWSKCSVSNMQNFISSGYNFNPAPKCIFKKGQRAGNAIKFSSSKLPGQQFDINTQCAAACDGCVPITEAPYNDVCHLLYCKPGKASFFYIIQGFHPALEGTTCARGKMCRVGKCV